MFKGNFLASLGCLVMVLLFNLIIGEMSVNYLLTVFLHHSIPFIAAAIIGLFIGEISIPLAVVVYILKLFHVF